MSREVNWLRVWEAVRDRGRFWTNISQSFLKLLTLPLFGDRRCCMCDGSTPEDTSFFTHLSQNHTPSSENLLVNLRSQDSDPSTNSFHCMRSVVSVYVTLSLHLHNVIVLCTYHCICILLINLFIYPLHWCKVHEL